MDILTLGIGIALGALITAVILTLSTRSRRHQEQAQWAERVAGAEAESRLEKERRQEIEKGHAVVEAEKDRLDRDLAVAQERVTQAQALIDEQKIFMAESRKEMEDAFRSLAATALKGNTEQFLQIAQEKWSNTSEQAAKDLDERRKAIETLLSPLKETLGKLDVRTIELEKAREGAYEGLKEQIKFLHEATRVLDDKTTTLNSALRGSQVRGRWGEIALRNIAELSGMSEHCDFVEQTQVGDGKRPDMVVRLPGKRFIAVDAKAPLTAYLEASEAQNDAAREVALGRHVAAVRNHMRALASREYAEELDGGVDLVVLFLPGDPFLAAAFSRDPDLQVEALRSRVLIVTPTTLVALLRTVAIYWQQQSLADNAALIAATARDLYERGAVFGEHLGKVGKGLQTALESYNSAVASFDTRFVPMGRRLEELKTVEQSKKRIEALPVLENVIRHPNEQLRVDFDSPPT